MVKVIFEGVGRTQHTDGVSWEARMRFFNAEKILKNIKRSGVLDSKADIWYDKARTHGIIYVGGHKPVGTFRIEREPYPNGV